MTTYGLIGYPLSHSFSKKYFSEKFEKQQIANTVYELFELQSITEFPKLVREIENLKGLNVTIPHKQQIIPYLDELDGVAARIGAVNVIKVMPDKKLKGYNSDYYGFRQSLINFLLANNITHHVINNVATYTEKAIILGNGGAAQAVKVALEDLGIAYQVVSQKASDNHISNKVSNEISYEILSNAIELFEKHQIIINTTPLGMYPNTDAMPQIPCQLLTEKHLIFDLVYNPPQTLLMQKAIKQGAKVQNGLEMLYLQAEKAWEIWNT
jgi:shikimate dehydrogenase